MKIRNGFVSNSSSSSFIVAFSNDIPSVKNIQKQMFGDAQYWNYDRYDGEVAYSTEEIAKEVQSWILDRQPEGYDSSFIDELLSGYIAGEPDYDYTKIHDDSYWAEYNRKRKENAEKVLEKFLDENPGKMFYLFEFSDDSVYGSMMEHSGIFDRLPHIRISKH